MTLRGSQEVGEVGESRVVILGGSFSQIHRGHVSLLKKALKISKNIKIGLVYKPSNKVFEELIEDFSLRREKLEKILIKLNKNINFEIIQIYDPYGPSIHLENLTDIVCTVETLPRALEINKIRASKGLSLLKVHFIELEKAEDGRPMRSTRIRAGEIDNDGKLLVKEAEIIYDG